VPLRTVLVSAAFLAEAAPHDRALVARAADSGAKVYEAVERVVDAASPVRTSSGIVAIADWTPSAIERTFSPEPALTLGLVDVQDPGNVGAAIRSADALGATGVITVDRTADPGGWKTLRGAMGSTFRIPVARASLDPVVASARRRGLAIVATVAEGADSISQLDLRAPALVLIGNEGAGLPDEIVGLADLRGTVPMRPGVNSLNVAVAAAILLYEARRQREVRIKN